METMPDELQDLIGASRQEFPMVLICLGAPRVVHQYLRRIVLGVGGETDQTHVIPAGRTRELVLNVVQGLDDRRTSFATAGECQLSDPDPPIGRTGAERCPGLIGQGERRELDEAAGFQEISSRRGFVGGGRAAPRRGIASTTAGDGYRARQREYSSECESDSLR